MHLNLLKKSQLIQMNKVHLLKSKLTINIVFILLQETVDAQKKV